jgi:hypothetical protein
MNTEKLKFNNSELDEKALASGTISRIGSKITKIVYAIDGTIADDIGAELFVHEFNEVAIFETIIKVIAEHEKIPYTNLEKTSLAHNLNAESDGEYVQDHYLLKEYVSSDRLPAIDYVFTPEETDAFRAKANKPRKKNP